MKKIYEKNATHTQVTQLWQTSMKYGATYKPTCCRKHKWNVALHTDHRAVVETDRTWCNAQTTVIQQRFPILAHRDRDADSGEVVGRSALKVRDTHRLSQSAEEEITEKFSGWGDSRSLPKISVFAIGYHSHFDTPHKYAPMNLHTRSASADTGGMTTHTRYLHLLPKTCTHALLLPALARVAPSH